MNLAMLPLMIGWPQIVLIVVVVLLLFGGRKIPELILVTKEASKDESKDETKEDKDLDEIK